MKILAMWLFTSVSAQAAPLLVPARDVAVEYQVRPRDHAPLELRVEIEGGGRHMRVAGADLPTAFLIDRPAETATILLPMLKLYAVVGVGRFDPEHGLLRGASFVRHGQRRLLGLVCTQWSADATQGRASACITEDGVILAGMAWDAHGALGAVQATSVQYGVLPPILFRRPPGFTNAGSLPVDGLIR